MTVALVVLWALAFWMVSGGDPVFTAAGAIFGYVIGSS